MRIAAKICGLNSADAIAAAVAGAASFAGFIFYPPSPRDVDPGEAAALARQLAPGILRVGVFVDPEDADIVPVLAKMKLDMIQLHGEEPPARVAALKDRFRIKVMKAIPIEGEVDLQRARDYYAVADWLMFDAKPPRDDSEALPGGNGRAFDWRLLRQQNLPVPWMLSGGLTHENLAEAVRLSGATTVDVSSGVERSLGEKDPAKIRAFLARAKEL